MLFEDQLHILSESLSCAQVYIGNLVGGMVTEDALRQLFNNTMAAAFPEQVRHRSLSNTHLGV